MATEKPIKAVCPTCKGNGYIKVPYELTKDHIVAQCTVCDSQGEIDANKIDDIIIDSDGIHRLQ
jgi:DnaJ-class molecular chaperone|tara:strand:- start:873 stop:1064 length:192 start_codon:yes stop_codon:yes gene_type:complete